MLCTTNIVSKRTLKVYSVFTTHISSSFTTDPTLPTTLLPSQYVANCWRRYQAYAAALPQNNALNGKIFEAIIASELYRQGLTPFFKQAKVTFVPNVDFDIVLYDTTKNIPISLSIKTSVRERYKQADLEAVALKYVHRNAKNYLIMLDGAEATSLKTKASTGDLLGIDEIIQADTTDFDNLITSLKTSTYGSPAPVEIITGSVV